MYASYYLAILGSITGIIYISLISSGKYINKNSTQWATTSIEQKRFVGYTNMVGNIFAILICGFDSIIFMNTENINLTKYLIKFAILITFIALSYDISTENKSYDIFISSLSPLQPYLQVLSIATIVQIIKKLDIKIYKSLIDETFDTRRDRGDSLGGILEDVKLKLL
jgi:hypothetical protein